MIRLQNGSKQGSKYNRKAEINPTVFGIRKFTDADIGIPRSPNFVKQLELDPK